MIAEVAPNIFLIPVPLPRNPLKAVNCYLIRGGERDLLVDTGMNRPECREALYAGLAALSVELPRTDLFITHLHADHSGLSAELAERGATPYASAEDGHFITANDHWEAFLDYAGRSGLPRDRLHETQQKHPGYRYRSQGGVDFRIVAEGDLVRAGDYAFRCIATPGHTPGHLCLYDQDKKLLISADLVLDDITPNISLWSDDGNPLARYLESLDRVRGLEVDLLLPGHRRLITDHRRRIGELERHHQERLAEVLSILGPEPLSGYQVASRMSWDLTYRSWDEFPLPQQWFATGEANAHLRYLEEQGTIHREPGDEKILYARSG